MLLWEHEPLGPMCHETSYPGSIAPLEILVLGKMGLLDSRTLERLGPGNV